MLHRAVNLQNSLFFFLPAYYTEVCKQIQILIPNLKALKCGSSMEKKKDFFYIYLLLFEVDFSSSVSCAFLLQSFGLLCQYNAVPGSSLIILYYGKYC